MGKHRKRSPVGHARRQLAIAGVGVVAVGGVLSSQLSAPSHITAQQPKGGPADMPSILSSDGSPAGWGASGDRTAPGPASGPTTTARMVNTAETTPAAPSATSGPAAGPYTWPSTQQSQRATRTGNPGAEQRAVQPTTGQQAGDALAMLAHSRKHQRTQQDRQEDAGGSAARQQGGGSSTSDHSIPDELATPHLDSQPSPTDTSQPDGLVERLIGSVSTLDVGGILGLPSRNPAQPSGQGGTATPPHDTTSGP